MINFIKIILYAFLALSITFLAISYKHFMSRKTKSETETVQFYDNDNLDHLGNNPTYKADIASNNKVRSSVRYNQGLYLEKKDFLKLKNEVINKKFPMVD